VCQHGFDLVWCEFLKQGIAQDNPARVAQADDGGIGRFRPAAHIRLEYAAYTRVRALGQAHQPISQLGMFLAQRNEFEEQWEKQHQRQLGQNNVHEQHETACPQPPAIRRCTQHGIDDLQQCPAQNRHKQHAFDLIAYPAHDRLRRKVEAMRQDISRWDVLRAAAQEVGLDADAVQRETESGSFTASFDAQIEEAYSLGIEGVPTYILNDKYAIVGAQPYEVFKRAIARLESETD